MIKCKWLLTFNLSSEKLKKKWNPEKFKWEKYNEIWEKVKMDFIGPYINKCVSDLRVRHSCSSFQFLWRERETHTHTHSEGSSDMSDWSSFPLTSNFSSISLETPQLHSHQSDTHPAAREDTHTHTQIVYRQIDFCCCALSIQARQYLRLGKRTRGLRKNKRPFGSVLSQRNSEALCVSHPVLRAHRSIRIFWKHKPRPAKNPHGTIPDSGAHQSLMDSIMMLK